MGISNKHSKFERNQASSFQAVDIYTLSNFSDVC